MKNKEVGRFPVDGTAVVTWLWDSPTNTKLQLKFQLDSTLTNKPHILVISIHGSPPDALMDSVIAQDDSGGMINGWMYMTHIITLLHFCALDIMMC